VQELIDHSAESQLSIELASECLVLAPWNDVPAATLLDQLRRSREAWQTLRPTRETTIPLRGDQHELSVSSYTFLDACTLLVVVSLYNRMAFTWPADWYKSEVEVEVETYAEAEVEVLDVPEHLQRHVPHCISDLP